MIRKRKRILSFFLALLMMSTSFMSMDVSVMAVKKEPTKLMLNYKSTTTYVGGGVKLKVSAVKPQKASKIVKWISSNKKTATVSSNGVVKAIKTGTVTITARSEISPEVAAKCKIKVYKATKKIKLLSKKNYTLDAGETVTLKAKVTSPKKGTQPIRWKSKNIKIAKVSAKGKVTAVSKGTTTITGHSGKVKVQVKIQVKMTSTPVTVPELTPLPEPIPTLGVTSTPIPGIISTPIPGTVSTLTPGTTPTSETTLMPTPETTSTPEITSTPVSGATLTPTPGTTSTPVPTSSTISGLDPETGITRAEWVSILADKMGYSVKAENLTQNPGTKEVLYEYDDIVGHKYAMKIEAAYCYGIMPSVALGDGKAHLFKPDALVTREFAALTAVRALGFAPDKALESSDSELLIYPNEDKTAVDIGMFSLKGNAFAPDDLLSEEEKDTVLSVMDEILQGREIDETHKDVLLYADETNIKDWSDIDGAYTLTEAGNGTLSLSVPSEVGTSEIRAGNIIVLPQSREYPAGMYFKVTKTGIDINGVTEFTGVVPELYEVFRSVDVEGYAGAYVEGIIPAEGVDFTYVDKPAAVYANRKRVSNEPQDINLGANLKVTIRNGKVSLEAGNFEREAAKKDEEDDCPIESESGVEVSVEIKIPKVKYNIDMDVGVLSLDVRQLYLELPDNSITLSGGIMGEIGGEIKNKNEEEIQIGTVPIPITAGLVARLGISVVLGAGGNITISYTLEGSIGMQYIDGQFMNFRRYSGDFDVDVEAEANIGMKIKLALAWTKSEMLVSSVELGLKANAKPTLHADVIPHLECVNVDVWTYLDFAIGTGDFFEFLGIEITKTWHAWDKNSSPFKWMSLCHIENGKLVDECTYGSVKLSGIVIDTNGKIVRGCSVTVISGDRVVNRLLTNEDGRFDVELAAGEYNVSFNNKNYKDATQIVKLDRSEKEKEMSVTMTPCSGKYCGIEWSIDENGRLTLLGECTEKISWRNAPWYEYYPNICSARIALTGLTDMGAMFQSYERLGSVDFAGTDTENVLNMSYMFNGCSNLKSLDLSSFNTRNVTDMEGMFSECSSLTSLDLSSLNTASVTNMEDIFGKCSSLMSLDLSNLDTENVTNMKGMFNECSSLWSLDLSSLNTGNVTNMASMFSGCYSLISLDLRNFNTEKVTNMASMFYHCGSLRSLDISSFDVRNVDTVSGYFLIFNQCNSLQTVYYPPGWPTNNIFL